MSIKKSDDSEIYSDPVQFKFNVNDGLRLISDAGSSSGNTDDADDDFDYSGAVTLRFTNGVYVGEAVDGIPNGWGTFSYTNGDVYNGEWKDGKRTGQGTLTLANGDIYEGEFNENELFKGTIAVNLSDGVYIYESDEFIDYKMNGQSTLTVKYTSGDASILSGVFTDGAINNGTLTYTWAIGDYFYYEGDFEDYVIKGHGTKTTYYVDGTHTTELGEFNDGLYNGVKMLYNSRGKMSSVTVYIDVREV